jgi:hypothetical protein
MLNGKAPPARGSCRAIAGGVPVFVTIPAGLAQFTLPTTAMAREHGSPMPRRGTRVVRH